MKRDDEIQDALDRLPPGERARGEAGAGDADRAAYALVYSALAEDAGFALPADFAEAMTARVMPAPVRPSVYERWILPLLMLASGAIALPTVAPALARAFRPLLTSPAGGPSTGAIAGLALLLVAAADQLMKKRLTQRSSGAEV